MEKYLENLYIPNHIKKIKLDIGLSVNAPVSQKLLEYEDDVFVFGFEPNIDSIVNIKNGNKKKYPWPIILNTKYISENRFFIIPIALENVNEEQNLLFHNTINDPGTSSLYKPINNKIGNYNKSYTPVFSLKHFFDLFNWKRFPYIEWIKIDAQGSDLNIIKGAKNYLMEKIVYVTLEEDSINYENVNDNNEQNITEYMLSNNFIKIDHPNTVDPTYLNKKFINLKDTIYLWQTS